jgi:hypothetical protein
LIRIGHPVMLATLIALKKGALALWRGGQKLVKRWRKDEDAVEVVADVNLPTRASQKEINKKQPWLWWLYDMLGRLAAGYVLAIKEAIVFLLIANILIFEYESEEAVALEWSRMVSVSAIAFAIIENISNLWANINITYAGLEVAEKGCSVLILGRVLLSSLESLESGTDFPLVSKANLPLFLFGLLLASLDLLDMGINIAEPKNHLPMTMLKKVMHSAYVAIPTRQEKVLRRLKTALLVPLRLLHLGWPAGVSMANIQVLFPLLFFVWRGSGKVFIPVSWAVGAISFFIQIGSLLLGNHKSMRQLKRDPFYYIWLVYNTLDAMFLSAIQAYLFATQAVFQIETVLRGKGDEYEVNIATDPYMQLAVFINLVLVELVTGYKTLVTLTRLSTKRMKIQKPLLVSANVSSKSHRAKIVISAHRCSVAMLRKRGIFGRYKEALQGYLNVDSTLVKQR